MKKLILALICFTTVSLYSQTTAFTYQGRLSDNGSPANGNYDLQFILRDAATTNGNQIGGTLASAPVSVSNGLFTVALDFGASAFNGNSRWLQIGVRTNGSSGAYSILSPLQPITSTPYAINAATSGSATTAANVTGNISDSQLSSNIPRLSGSPAFTGTVTATSFAGNGALVTNVNAALLNGLAATNFWQLGGNSVTSGQFIGTTNSQALEFRANNMRVLRVEWPTTPGPLIGGAADAVAGAPNMIGGAPINYVGNNIQGATIAGGGATNYFGVPLSNTVMAAFGTIGGGYDNTILSNGFCATITGGAYNLIDTNGFEAFIGGGYWNTIQSNAFRAIIVGGTWNRIGTNSGDAFIGSGAYNAIQSDALHSIIVGGTNNAILVGARDSVIVGGQFNTNGAIQSVIGGGYQNTIQTNAADSTIGGGFQNTIQIAASSSTIGGGFQNIIQTNADNSTISGGVGNVIQSSAQYSTIGGGWLNTNAGSYAVVPGGDQNVAGTNSFAAGHRAKATHKGTFVWADSQNLDFASTATNQFLIRATNGVGINKNNPASALDVNGTVTATSFLAGGSTVWNASNDGPGSGLDADLLDGLSAGNASSNVAINNGTLNNNLNAEMLGGLRATNFWKTGGNSGTSPGTDFIGTTDNQALEFKVNGQRALRLQPNANAPSVIGGYSGNFIPSGVYSSTIGGGGAGIGLTNIILTYGSTIGGGLGNTIQTNANDSTIGGGALNTIQTNASYSTIGGGGQNTIQTNASYSTIAGGNVNVIQSNATYSTISGGIANTVQTNAFYSAIGGGYQNTIQFHAADSVISGGFGNAIQSEALFSSISGGYQNYILTNATYSAIGGGDGNTASGQNATIPGGHQNTASGDYSFAAGRFAKAANDGAFVWADSQSATFSSTDTNQFLIRASGGVGINTNNPGATLDVNGSLRINNGTVFTNLLAGQAQMPGGSSTSKTNLTITFPKTFSTAPKMMVTVNADPGWDVDDTFVASVRKITTTNCVVNIVRVDSAGGWSQVLRVNWMAWQ